MKTRRGKSKKNSKSTKPTGPMFFSDLETLTLVDKTNAKMKTFEPTGNGNSGYIIDKDGNRRKIITKNVD